MTEHLDPTPEEARLLLERADSVGAAASANVSWPYIATLLSIGAATSLGTFAMSISTGTGYLVAMVGMLAWVMIAIGFMVAYGRTVRLGFKKRWRIYIGTWAVAYAVAVLLASFSRGNNLAGGVFGAVLIAAVTVTGALVEARR